MKHTLFQQISDPTARHAWVGLTPDLLERTRSRVKVLAWLMSVFMVLAAGFRFATLLFAGGEVKAPWIWYTVFGIIVSGGLLALAYQPRVGHAKVLYATLGYEIAVCWVLAVITPEFAYAATGHLPLITWVAPFIILFPLIVPSPPHITLLVALAAAATRPLALTLLDLRHGMEVGGIYYGAAVMSPLLAVVVAYYGSRVVHGMNVDLAEAQRMGSYTLETLLGTGGMGEVWLARHQLLARPAAVKLVKAENLAANLHDQQVVLARFEREAQVTAALQSHHTVDLYDFGVARNGTFYYVMELLNGLDLSDLVTRFGPLVPSRAVHFLTQMCHSLGEAHERGLIHRDVKPGNVYVCQYGRSVDFVKILDFGLVKIHEPATASDLQLTEQGTVGGTPAFIAPEQVLGDPVDARTDIYQLGCVAYWMLTGQYVFEADTAMKTMMRHMEEMPEPPSRRAEQDVPEDLDRAVLACLEKDPAKRPQTVDELAEVLGQCEVGEPWSKARGRQWWEKHLPDLLAGSEPLPAE
jgi:tRNA A-37 threonylcarbamoyl transferase component Bud32